LLSANLERDTADTTLAEFLRGNQAEVEGIFGEALIRARKAGELSRHADTKALARFFTVTIQGMRAMARLKSDRKSLEQVARVALATLDQ
jgi:TetR/AcrR family transcriptional regulator, transcriptional repressor for nem operon